MIETHRYVEMPPDASAIWRYVDIPKLVHLLSRRQLHLTRCDQFRDKWEGTWPEYVVTKFRATMALVAGEAGTPAETGFLESSCTYYVSCWHESEFESAALWDLYARESGVAILSSVQRLKEAITCQDSLFLGRVRYANYKTVAIPTNVLVPPYLKRESFSHEKEVRLLRWVPENTADKNQAMKSSAIDIDPNILC
jgi:hypothetical protein